MGEKMDVLLQQGRSLRWHRGRVKLRSAQAVAQEVALVVSSEDSQDSLDDD